MSVACCIGFKMLCFRCEHRAKYFEEGHTPRYECGLPEGSKAVCYMYKPVKPCSLTYPDYEGEYGRINRERLPIGGIMGSRMQFKEVAQGKLSIEEKDGVYTPYWVSREKST